MKARMSHLTTNSYFAVALFASTGTAIVSAQDALEELEPTIVTASRIEESLMDTPYTVDVITDAFIADNDRRTLPEALQFTPGVLVQKTAHGHGSPFIRGFTGRQNLLMVDGVRLNNSTWRSGPVQYWNTVDSFAVERMELVKSQGSVLYGSDAVGGTLNVLSKSSNFMLQPAGEVFSHGSAYYEYRTNGEGSHVGRVESSFGVGEKYGVFFGFTGKDFGDIEDGSVGRMKNTGYPEQDFDFRFDMALSADTTLTIGHQYVNQDDIWRWHRTVYNPGWVHGGHVAAGGAFLREVYDQEHSLTYLKIAGSNAEEDAWVKSWQATLSWQKSQDSTSQIRTLTDRRAAGIDMDTYGLDIGLESDLGPGTLVYGFDYYVDDVSADAYRNGTFRATDRPVADDSSYHLFGAYTQYVFRPVEPLEITAGVRYTHAEAEWDAYRPQGAAVDQGGQGEWDNVSGSLRAVYTLNDCWNIYGGLSQAFRAPNLNDLTGNSLALSGLTSHGSPNLEPEEYLTAELGTRFGTGDMSLSLAGFYTWTDGAITGVTDPITGDSLATNGQDGYIYGFEMEGAWNFHPDWMLSGFLAWQEGKTETAADGERWLTRQLPFTGSLALRWTHPNEKFWVEGRLLGAVGEDRIHPADQARDNQRIPTGGTPGYVVAMLRAGWQATDHLELTCGLENLTDKDYRNHGSGQNEAGFGAVVGAKLIW